MSSQHTLIIGGTKGLGRTVAKMLQHEGHQLSILARNNPEEFQGDAFYVQGDLLEEASYLSAVSEVIQTRGKINHLVFLQRFRSVGEDWYGELEVSLNATRKIIEHLKEAFVSDPKGLSSIVMVSSVAGQLANNSQPLSYSIAKAGLNCMVKFYAAHFGVLGIRVNGVSPVTFVKEEAERFYFEKRQDLNRLYEKMTPLGRMCTAKDVANVISFLCSQKASFINGQNIIVDGGLSVVAHESLARTLTNI